MNLKLSEDQVLYFRAQRSYLAGAGAESVAAAAKAIVGAQSQQLHPSLHAISMRTATRPTAKIVQQSLFGESRTLVRTWGQRDTIHLYDASTHWRPVTSLNQVCSTSGRGGPLPTEAAVKRALKRVETLERPVTRGDLIASVPAPYAKAIAARAAMANIEPKRMAAARLIWRLARRGDLSIAEKVGVEQSYVSRELWYPDLPWPNESDFHADTISLARDYLHTYGPATARDMAHFLGATVTQARTMIRELNRETLEVECESRGELIAMKADEGTLRTKIPKSSEWPLRMLPLWETLLMGHADKTWTVPIEEERKLVWRKAAMVSAVILDRGRVVATWSQKSTKRRLSIVVSPLSSWRKSKHLKQTTRESERLAKHLEIPDVELQIT